MRSRREWNVVWLAVVYLGLGACGGGEGVVSREYAMVVSDMTCESCIGPIRVALQGVEGVLDSRFDLSVQTVVVEVAVDGPDVHILVEAIRGAGYLVETGS